jgi:hypothetical protein
MFVLMSLDRRYITVGWREKDKKPVLFRTRDGHFIGINPDYEVQIREKRFPPTFVTATPEALARLVWRQTGREIYRTAGLDKEA